MSPFMAIITFGLGVLYTVFVATIAIILDRYMERKEKEAEKHEHDHNETN